MGFFWKHKLLLLLLAGVGAYLYVCPSDRFGFARKNLVVFDRIPISLFDVYISPEGERVLFQNLSRPADRSALCDTLTAMQQKNQGRRVTLLIGEGFDRSGRISLMGDDGCSQVSSGLNVRRLSSRDAVHRYNTLRDKGEEVAVVLVVKR